MIKKYLFPLLYQANTRVWLHRISHHIDRPATLDDIPDVDLAAIANLGFDWVYFFNVNYP